jgi:hypothetical protein
MYDDFKCKILYEGKITDYIEITNGVRQGCILSPIIFLLVLNNVTRNTLGNRKRVIEWGMKDRLEDLDFVDDICLLSQRYSDMKDKLIRLQQEAKLARLNINVNKTKEMRTNTQIEEKLSMTNNEIEQVESFTYLRSIVTQHGGTDQDINHRIKKKQMQLLYNYIRCGRTKIFQRKLNYGLLILM